jgi:hypothetical protein
VATHFPKDVRRKTLVMSQETGACGSQGVIVSLELAAGKGMGMVFKEIQGK